MKKIINFLLICLLVITIPTSSSAADKKTDNKGNSTVLEIINLKPEPESEVIIPIQAVRWSDGKISVRGSGNGQAESAPFSFAWKVDIENGTYKTTKLEFPVSTLQPSNTKTETNDLKNVIVPLATYTYQRTVQVVTTDIPGYELAKTTHYLSWYGYSSNYTVDYKSRSISAWAANPSPPGTH